MFAWVAVVALSLTLAPLASAAPRVLREIEGGPTTQTVCGNVVVHANAAIAAAVRGDAALGRAVVRLRSIDLDESETFRRNGVDELERFANDVRENAARGAAEVKRLSEIADRSQAGQRQEIRAFAAPLGNALEAQSKMATDLAEFLEQIQDHDIRGGTRDPIASDAGHEPPVLPGRTLARPTAPNALGQRVATALEPRSTLAATARTTASDIEKRTSAITAEESRAAEHAEAAVRGCS